MNLESSSFTVLHICIRICVSSFPGTTYNITATLCFCFYTLQYAEIYNSTFSTDKVHASGDSSPSIPILCLPVLSERECSSSTGKENENRNEISICTDGSVKTKPIDSSVLNVGNGQSSSAKRDNSVQENNKNKSQDLVHYKEVLNFDGEYESNSFEDIANDVEFIDSFAFDSTDIDELEEYVGAEELNLY